MSIKCIFLLSSLPSLHPPAHCSLVQGFFPGNNLLISPLDFFREDEEVDTIETDLNKIREIDSFYFASLCVTEVLDVSKSAPTYWVCPGCRTHCVRAEGDRRLCCYVRHPSTWGRLSSCGRRHRPEAHGTAWPWGRGWVAFGGWRLYMVSAMQLWEMGLNKNPEANAASLLGGE